MNKKDSITKYNEREFLDFVKNIYEGNGTEQEINLWVDWFVELIAHPESSDLIFYPPDERDDSPEGVIAEIKRWYTEQGLPCFKEQ